MNINTTRNCAFGILALTSVLACTGCSQKPSSEEIAAQVRAAMAEEKAKEQAAASAPTAPPVAEPTAPRPATKHRSAPAKPVAATPPPPPPVQHVVCANCGVVVSVREIEQAGKGSGLGVIAGGVTGGIVGNQVGQGTGRDLATIAGVVGGAIAGNKIEENVKKTRVYDVTLRMENGESRVLRYSTAPGIVAGDKVRVENGSLIRQ